MQCQVHASFRALKPVSLPPVLIGASRSNPGQIRKVVRARGRERHLTVHSGQYRRSARGAEWRRCGRPDFLTSRQSTSPEYSGADDDVYACRHTTPCSWPGLVTPPPQSVSTTDSRRSNQPTRLHRRPFITTARLTERSHAPGRDNRSRRHVRSRRGHRDHHPRHEIDERSGTVREQPEAAAMFVSTAIRTDSPRTAARRREQPIATQPAEVPSRA